eukprot:893909-Prymnesium_polylepis.1
MVATMDLDANCAWRHISISTRFQVDVMIAEMSRPKPACISLSSSFCFLLLVAVLQYYSGQVHAAVRCSCGSEGSGRCGSGPACATRSKQLWDCTSALQPSRVSLM